MKLCQQMLMWLIILRRKSYITVYSELRLLFSCHDYFYLLT
ncbi:unnamed protein product [Arabidopsis halleri]